MFLLCSPKWLGDRTVERRLNQSSFEQWLRTGRLERKFNPYHDPDDGRFTFGPSHGGALPPRPMSLQSRSAGQVRRAASPTSRKVPPDPIGDIIERELRQSGEAHGMAGGAAQERVQHAKSVLTHWPIAGGSEAMLNRADKPDEGDPHYGAGRKRGKHGGVDIKAPTGTAVRAAGKGIVVGIVPNPSRTFGEQIVIYHGDNIYTQYAHLAPGSTRVKVGSRVVGGEQIGSVGRSGNTPKLGDSHLHFEIRIGSPRPATAGGMTRDPLRYLLK